MLLACFKYLINYFRLFVVTFYVVILYLGETFMGSVNFKGDMTQEKERIESLAV